jgi:NADPH:quinone reductase-like Zn-dependent oxidoreductase
MTERYPNICSIHVNQREDSARLLAGSVQSTRSRRRGNFIMSGTMPTTMRAALLTGHGGPEVLVVRDDVPVPIPEPGQVLIEVAACGVNNTDINTRVGWYSRSVTAPTTGEGFDDARSDDAAWGAALRFPRIQGADPCGRVVAVGSDDRRALLGRRVIVDPWIRDPSDPADRGLAGYLGSEVDGGFAEYCAVPATNVHVIERDDLTDVELAALACSWSTAQHMLDRVGLTAGQRIAVTGASGGVGTALVSLAALRGATVVGIAGASKCDAVAALGAHAVVARDADDAPSLARDAAGGSLDVVADVVGGPSFGRWLDMLRRGGRYVTSGAIAGPIVELDLRTMYLNDLELIGATVFEPRVFAELVALVNAGRIRPPVAATFPLDDIHAAQEMFGRKEHVGAIVITVR